MNTTSDTIHGSPTFHTTIKKIDGGMYQATTTVQGVEPVTASSEREAIAKARMAVEAFIGQGSGSQK